MRRFKYSKGMQIIKERGTLSFIKHRCFKLKTKFIERISRIYFKLSSKKVLNYQFAFFAYGLSGHYALRKMLTYCGLKEVKIHDREFGKHFLLATKKLKEKGGHFLSFHFYDTDLRDYPQNVNKILKNTKILMSVRDPISRLKTKINHGINIKPHALSTLNTPINEALDKIRYHKNSLKPSCDELDEDLDYEVPFTYYSVAKPLLKNNEILYIDTKEFMPSSAFSTFQNLSVKLGICPPKEELREKFEYIFWNAFSMLLPFHLLISSKDFPHIPRIVLIIEENMVKDCEDKWSDLKPYLLESSDLHYENLAIRVLNKHAKIILESEEILVRLRTYFKEFVRILDEKRRFREENAIDEEQVLSYLKEKPAVAKKLKSILDKELIHIKKTRPDIIASWEYYQKFEELC